MSRNEKLIAIIEDEITIAQMYRIKLELAGYQVRIADNGRCGLEMIQKFPPDLILLDIMMPHMNGDEVLAGMRADKNLAHTPVIILTNVGNEELQRKIEKFRVAGYLQKSDLTPRQVLEMVDKVLKEI